MLRAECRLESSKTGLLETTTGVPSGPGELVESVTATTKEECKAHSGAFPPETEPLLTEEHASPLMNTAEHLHDISGYSTEDLGLQKGQESNVWGVDTLASISPPSAGQEEQKEDQRGQIAEGQDSVDHEEWEVIPEHSVWGDASKNSSTDEPGIALSQEDKELEPVDCLDGDAKAKRVAAVPPMPQNIHVTFCVHYITHSEGQLIAVTGDHECLGQWHSYLPLKCDKDGFWSDSVVLPVDTRIEWKFILVEDGKVRRWEECDNRVMVTEHEDGMAHQWWGYH
ncbi:starch-binding domain-containing protein 1 [Alligator sinensis]|uniref:Starch-binding domain-containing protein 1 n=1 Tax=Alligator sinensis TaxID=38654 RepID=A0A3Q0FKM1_ALLSI|nr:starch-binding domain-containing protein 1 [Alligator sinensis]